MNFDGKKTLILKTAMKLFAVKGTAATSMQEIAESCGMSKGSLYLHFKSKEDLEQSLFIYCYQMLQEHLMQVDNEPDLTPKEKMTKQIEAALHLVLELREFLAMQFKEYVKNGQLYNEPEFIRNTNTKLLYYSQNILVQVYGQEITPYTADLIVIVYGMLGSYMRVLFDPSIQIEIGRLASFLVLQLDLTSNHFLKMRPKPLFSEELFMNLGHNSCQLRHERHPLQVVKELRQTASAAIEDNAVRQDVSDCLSVMEKELLELHPRRAILLGMMSFLHSIPTISIPVLAPLLQELEQLLQPLVLQAME